MITFLTFLAFILIILVIVIIHEIGHGIAARLLNIKITTFSIGLSLGLPPIYQCTIGRDQTLFSIYPIPLGGSISFFEWLPEHENPNDPNNPADPFFHFNNFHRAINKRPLFQQHLVDFGGVALNVIFAIIIYTCVFTVGIEGEQPIVGEVSGIAQQSGLLPGDEITHVHNQRTMRWDAIINQINQQLLFESDAVKITVTRGDQSLDLLLPLYNHNYNQTIQESFYEMFGIAPHTPPIKILITGVHPDSPAAQSGLEVNDVIYEVNNQPIKTAIHWMNLLNSHLNKSLNIKVLRENLTREFSVTPKLRQGRARLGITLEYQEIVAAEKTLERYSLIESVIKAVDKVQQDIIIVIYVLWKIFTFQASFLNLNGLFTLYRLVQHTLQDGFCYFLMLVATINSSVAVSNLLPLFPLDGNSITRPHLQFILGRQWYRMATHTFLNYFGMSVVILLIALSIVSDFIKWN